MGGGGDGGTTSAIDGEAFGEGSSSINDTSSSDAVSADIVEVRRRLTGDFSTPAVDSCTDPFVVVGGVIDDA